MNIKIILTSFALYVLPSCYNLFYMGGANPLYIQKYSDYTKQALDSACVLFLDEYPEHKAYTNKTYANISTDTMDTYGFNTMDVYHKTNIYYPYAPGFMGRFYLNQTLDSSVCFVYTIVDRENYSELQARYLLKYDIPYPIFSKQLSKEDKQLIVKRFNIEISNKIDSILQHIK